MIAGIRYSGVGDSGVRFLIFKCNSVGLSNVVRYKRVFVTEGFVNSGVPLYINV